MLKILKNNKLIFFSLLFIIIILIFIFKNTFTNLIFNKISIETNQGEVNIKNIYGHPVIEYPTKDIVFKKSDDYSMFYYKGDDLFNITILNPDIQTARDKAEDEFLKTLGITKEAACKLNVSLGVPINVNEKTAGIDYKLSFCPDGIPFPK